MAFDVVKGKEVELKSDVVLNPDSDAELTVKLFNEYDEDRSLWETQAVESKAFINNAQWKSADKRVLDGRGQPAIVNNILFPAKEQAVAMLTANKPRFQSTPREYSDSYISTVFSDLMSWIWEQSDGNVELKRSIDDYYVMGVGWIIAYWDGNKDYGKGEICIKSLDPITVYVDPNSKDRFCRDAAHIIISDQYTFEQLQTAYPNKTNLIKKAPTGTIENRYITDRTSNDGQTIFPDNDDGNLYRVFDRYSKIMVTFYRVFDPKDKEVILDEESYKELLQQPAFIVKSESQEDYEFKDTQDIERLYEKVGGVFHVETIQKDDGQGGVTFEQEQVPGVANTPNSVSGSTVVIVKTTVEDLINRGYIQSTSFLQTRIQRTLSIEDSVVLYKQILPLENYPIVPLMNNHNRNPYPMSDIQICRTIQEKINFTQSQITNYVANTANIKVLAPDGTDIVALSKTFNKPGVAIGTYNPEFGAPSFWNPPPMPNHVFASIEMDKRQIYEQLGVFPLMQGDSSDAPETYKGTIAIEENGQKRIKSKRDDIESAINVLARAIVEMIQTRYTAQKVIRLLNPDQTSRMVEINKPEMDDSGEIVRKINDITVGRYDIILVSGSTLPSNRYARLEYYLQLKQLGYPIDEEILKQTDIPNIDKVLQKMDVIAQQQQAIAQLEEQVKMLKGDLQTANREVIQSGQKVEIEKTKTKLNKVVNNFESAQVLQDQMAKADLKDKSNNGLPN